MCIHSTTDLLARIKELEMERDELSYSHLGILSPAAIRRALRLMAGPVDIIALDFRKLHDWDELLGWDVADHYFGRFARTRQHDETSRMADTRGQYAGDELVIACAPGTGQGLLSRLVQALDELTAELTPAQRVAMAERTGGLVDGFCATFCLIEHSHYPLIDAARGITQCGELKTGPVTGSRSTSGKPGTIIGSLPALACTPPPGFPDDDDGTEDGGGPPRAVTLTSITIDQALMRNRLCPNCQGPHWGWQCPEIAQRLFAPPATDWRDADLGRELCRMRWRDFARFVVLLRTVGQAGQLRSYAASYVAYLETYGPASLTIGQVLTVWGRILTESGPAAREVAA